jgi:hypothetical protein
MKKFLTTQLTKNIDTYIAEQEKVMVVDYISSEDSLRELLEECDAFLLKVVADKYVNESKYYIVKGAGGDAVLMKSADNHTWNVMYVDDVMKVVYQAVFDVSKKLPYITPLQIIDIGEMIVGAVVERGVKFDNILEFYYFLQEIFKHLKHNRVIYDNLFDRIEVLETFKLADIVIVYLKVITFLTTDLKNFIKNT